MSRTVGEHKTPAVERKFPVGTSTSTSSEPTVVRCSNKSASKRKLIKKEFTLETPEEEKQRLRRVIEFLYSNGSNARATKAGNPATLMTKLLQPRHIATCGLFKKLSPSDVEIVDVKGKAREREDPEFKKRIANLILSYDCKEHKERGEEKDVFVRLTDIGRSTLLTIASGSSGSDGSGDELGKKSKGIFNVRVIFEDQERQKVLPK